MAHVSTGLLSDVLFAMTLYFSAYSQCHQLLTSLPAPVPVRERETGTYTRETCLMEQKTAKPIAFNMKEIFPPPSPNPGLPPLPGFSKCFPVGKGLWSSR
ncbi:hypothetical protein E2C01_030009 [Portunus trituberculatus]|uniref:Uncharacterized protein n=1 Tax=Portunus trituberculatus TaxID=210409 RepID=A0A5B7ETK5_PORTR|nr:hypothetical protein [Portunus trituberculatus]